MLTFVKVSWPRSPWFHIPTLSDLDKPSIGSQRVFVRLLFSLQKNQEVIPGIISNPRRVFNQWVFVRLLFSLKKKPRGPARSGEGFLSGGRQGVFVSPLVFPSKKIKRNWAVGGFCFASCLPLQKDQEEYA
ncbi:unnamed protein product [Clonostachys solani]|uniref:Uncharacterized protein n=1 Tax=Clonostachys solani TaxID=160281 RepID=A0A9P0EK20_9HYPO|nr:unnamed protein product [Clonostachys solani]